MNIKHITQRMAGVHLGQCAARLGEPCDCGAVAGPAPSAGMTRNDEQAPLEYDALADPEIDLKGTSDVRFD